MEGWSYSKAGVDLKKHEEMHSIAYKAIKEISDRLGIEINLEGYGSSVALNDMRLVMHTDGVGTKTVVLEKLGKLDVAGWDCVAMNTNDVACAGSRPILLSDYISMPSADIEKFSRIISGIKRASEEAKVLLVGGETAILPGLANAVDVVCTVLAVKEKSEGFKGMGDIGDAIVGVRSTGPHANGYSLIRKVLQGSLEKPNVVMEGVNMGEWITRPTAIYSELILNAIKRGLVKAAAHITGGAFSKLKRILPPNGDAHLRLESYDKGFEVLRKVGNISLQEMYRVFNMGIGLLLSTSSDKVDELLSFINKEGFEGFVVGNLVKGNKKVLIDVKGGKRVEL
ncbi:MAG: phosphoribosylformylglycinamidine cyclo-ligase [Caldisphaeraceae archaeon]|nr:phosphoribosylformylglycinamidine cyclo-ligase [Caldisphaeraceae archaeon]MEB3797483.1 phosphoribosylformylglycinamidine cyclo-ligase [Caldisphaeraceae archaeon]